MSDYDTAVENDDSNISESVHKILSKSVEERIDNIGSVHELPGIKGEDEYLQIKAFYIRHKAPQDLKDMYPSMHESEIAGVKRILSRLM